MTGENQGDGGRGGDGEERKVERLLTDIGALARADEAEMAFMPQDFAAPLSQGERADIAAAILGRRPEARPASAEREGAIPIARARRRRAVWLGAAAVPIAAAAALALVLGPLSGDRLPPLPGYAVMATGGIKEFRSGERIGAGETGTTARTERVSRQTELVVVGRPETAVAGPVAARAFLVQGQVAREVEARIETATSGAVEVRLRPGVDSAGRWQLRVLVGRPDAVRAAAATDATGTPPDAYGRRWLTVPLDVVD
jgi:hypothetical protein